LVLLRGRRSARDLGSAKIECGSGLVREEAGAFPKSSAPDTQFFADKSAPTSAAKGSGSGFPALDEEFVIGNNLIGNTGQSLYSSRYSD
jgi:hypothetical protein